MEAPSSFTSSSNPRLCQLCLRLAEQDIDFLLTSPAQLPREVVHHLSYADLTQSVQSGCPLCAVFQKAIFQRKASNHANEIREERRLTTAGRETAFRVFPGNGKLPGEDIFAAHVLSLRYGRVTTVHDPNAWYKGHSSPFGNPNIGRSTVLDQHGMLLQIAQEMNLTQLSFSYPTGKSGPIGKDKKYEDAGEVQMAVVEGCHEYPIKRRAITPCVEYDTAAEWLQSCSTSHDTCRPFEICELPTRVVEISQDDSPPKLRLIETCGNKGKYVTLTHCWGSEPIAAETTKKNVPNYKGMVPFEELPRNFKDAITVTQALGFEYIWIDSLCIIQDSKEDWDIECSRMAAIYANSVLTIAGSAASYADHGFLHPRPQSSSSIKVDLMRETKLTGTVLLDVSSEDWELQISQEPESPLSKRGWILQERLLSSRILYLGSRQMYFECDSSERYESYPRNTIPARDRSGGSVSTKGAESLRKNILKTVSPQSVYALWYSIIVACSACQLTYGDDRLPSLSGLANRFQARLKGDEYLAGIWRGDMIHGLLWYRKYPKAEPQSVYSPRNDAPSWSWVSCDRPVRFYVDFWAGWLDGRQWKPFVQEVETLDISTRLSGQNRFGRVDRGTWKVRGCVRECVLQHMKNSNGSSNWFVCDGQNCRPQSWFFPDGGEFDSEETSPYSKIHALLLGQKPDAIGHDTIRYALVLKPDSEQSCTFRRIGITSLGCDAEHLVAKNESFAWLEKGERLTIDIV